MKNLIPVLLITLSATSLMAIPVTPEPSTYGIGIGVMALGFAAYRSFTKRK